MSVVSVVTSNEASYNSLYWSVYSSVELIFARATNGGLSMIREADTLISPPSCGEPLDEPP